MSNYKLRFDGGSYTFATLELAKRALCAYGRFLEARGFEISDKTEMSFEYKVYASSPYSSFARISEVNALTELPTVLKEFDVNE